MPGGVLITLEGIDGCGKTTQARLLQERLELDNSPHLATREPGGTAAGEIIRRVLLQKGYPLSVEAETLLYMAARVELVTRVIRPALAAGQTVICDRFIDSSIAYQGYGSGGDLTWIRNLNLKVTGGIVPRLTFVLDLPVEEAIRRRGGCGDRMEEKDYSFHQRVRRGYLALAGQEPERIKVLDASKAPEEQHRTIWQQVSGIITPYS